MWKINKFFLLYSENKKEIDKDAVNMRQQEFMDKYHIGTDRYYTYFKWKSLYVKNRVSAKHALIQDERVRKMNEKNQVKQVVERVKDIESYNHRAKEIADKLGLTIYDIKSLSETYSLSELETARKVNGKLVIQELKMSKSIGYMDTMFTCQS